MRAAVDSHWVLSVCFFASGCTLHGNTNRYTSQGRNMQHSSEKLQKQYQDKQQEQQQEKQPEE